ncbi:MAG: FAD-dependent oxidoreductase [Cyclobacteriaceae bacterium]|nr:FAD-dependent oxidoreductase [Cyclobacteriaceae bacterium]
MKRRTAIKHIGFGLTAALGLPHVLQSCNTADPGPEIQYDGVVGIIGAGAAGLFAADILRTKGVKVRIFEAAGRVGGRIYSIRSNDPDFTAFSGSDFPQELGADRYFGSNGLWAELVRTVGARSYELSSTLGTPRYYFDNTYLSDAEIDALPDGNASKSKFLAYRNFIQNLSSISGSSINAAANALNPAVLPLVNSQVGNWFGADNGALSATGLAEALTKRETDSKEFVLSSNPMSEILISRYFKTVELVETRKQVTRITQNGDTVELAITNRLDNSSETVTVNKLIIAVPVSILKAGDIEFSPALPSAKNTAMAKIGMGGSIRVLVDFRQNIWGQDVNYIFGGTNGPLYFSGGLGRSDFNKVLTVTINGSKANQFTAMPNANNEIIAALREELSQIIPADDLPNNDVLAFIKGVPIIKNWGQDAFIKGGYSIPLAGGTEADRETLAEPIGQQLFFAGEATDIKGEWGTVNGALNSGERAALEVIDAILNPVV